MARIKFLNTYIDNLTMKEAVNEIDKLINCQGSSYVVTPNLDHIVILETNSEFAKAYKYADLIVADGKPLIWISKILKNPIREKISGADLFPQMCEMCASKGYSVFILGAAEGVADEAAQRLRERYKGLKIVGTYSPPIGFENNTNELVVIKRIVRKAKPDVLAVSLGSPKGEIFLNKHIIEYEIPLGISIGAAIDFEAGNVKRAPKWMADNGLEWIYRIIQEPKRMIKRYWNDAVKIIPIIKKYK